MKSLPRRPRQLSAGFIHADIYPSVRSVGAKIQKSYIDENYDVEEAEKNDPSWTS